MRLTALALAVLASARAQSLPTGFEKIDSAFQAILDTHNIPGGSLAIAKDGRLVMVRGYGFDDVELRHATQPSTRLRFGSIGKTITAIAVMKLVESGKLDLDAHAFEILSIQPRSGRLVDGRVNSITIRNLLTHSGGWDTTVS